MTWLWDLWGPLQLLLMTLQIVFGEHLMARPAKAACVRVRPDRLARVKNHFNIRKIPQVLIVLVRHSCAEGHGK